MSGVASVFGFAGEQFDSETGFTFLRARYLDPRVRGVLSQPTIAAERGLSLVPVAILEAPAFLVEQMFPSGDIGEGSISPRFHPGFTPIFERGQQLALSCGVSLFLPSSGSCPDRSGRHRWMKKGSLLR